MISPNSVELDGKAIACNNTVDQLLVELYRQYVNDYPKFFKMDTLSRLGFIASELLLQAEGNERFVPTEDRAVILANRSASIKNDTDYLKTIAEDNYYPSPALFVYTLPNIVTGEIAIRHHLHGETSFYILERPEQLEPIIRSSFIGHCLSILAGWCECSGKDTFNAKLQIIWNN